MLQLIIFCFTIIILMLIIRDTLIRYFTYKTYEIRRKYPLRLDNVPYTCKNIWEEGK